VTRLGSQDVLEVTIDWGGPSTVGLPPGHDYVLLSLYGVLGNFEIGSVDVIDV
jgi:hypothetical protein